MMRIVILQLLTLTALLSGYFACERHETICSGECIYLDAFIDNNIDERLTSLGYDPSELQLTLPDSIFLSGKSRVIYVADGSEDFFVTDGKRILRFDRYGNFINAIGVVGHGYNEYQHIMQASFDTANNEICIYGGNGRICVYSLDGKSINQLTLQSDAYISGAFKLKDGFWAEEFNFKDGNSTLAIVRFNKNGEREEETLIYSKSGDTRMDYYTSTIVYQKDNQSYDYYCQYNSTIYNISDSIIDKKMIIDGGKHAFDGNRLNDMDYRMKYRDQLSEIIDIQIESGYIYLVTVCNDKITGSVLNSDTGRCLINKKISHPAKGGGLNVWSNRDVNIWPQYAKNDKIYGIYFDANKGREDEYANLLIMTQP